MASPQEKLVNRILTDDQSEFEYSVFTTDYNMDVCLKLCVCTYNYRIYKEIIRTFAARGLNVISESMYNDLFKLMCENTYVCVIKELDFFKEIYEKSDIVSFSESIHNLIKSDNAYYLLEWFLSVKPAEDMNIDEIPIHSNNIQCVTLLIKTLKLNPTEQFMWRMATIYYTMFDDVESTKDFISLHKDAPLEFCLVLASRDRFNELLKQVNYKPHKQKIIETAWRAGNYSLLGLFLNDLPPEIKNDFEKFKLINII